MTKLLFTLITTTLLLGGCASSEGLRVEEVSGRMVPAIDPNATPGPAPDGKYYLACDGCPAARILKWYQSMSGRKITMPDEVAASQAIIFVSFSGFTKTEALAAFRRDLARVGILLVENSDGSLSARKEEPNQSSQPMPLTRHS